MKRKPYEEEMRRLHGELVEAAGVGQAQGAEGLHRVRGPRRRRQGRHDQGDHRARQPAGVSRGRAAGARPSANNRRCTLQRYIPHLPAAGEVVIFDRSWYNRAGVERVMGFCTEEQTKPGFSRAPPVERTMVDSGIMLLKYWLEVDADEQTRRLEGAHRRPAARSGSSPHGPQVLRPLVRLLARPGRDVRRRPTRPGRRGTSPTPSDKKRARLNIISHLLSQIPYEPLEIPEAEFPPRQDPDGYTEPDWPLRWIPEPF